MMNTKLAITALAVAGPGRLNLCCWRNVEQASQAFVDPQAEDP
jgi:hypothetical protein